MAPEKPVGCVASVSYIVEKHFQLLVVVKVGHNDGADGRGSSKSPARYILQRRTTQRFNSSKPTEHKILCTNTICSYAEFRVAALKEKPVWSHPVAVDDVRLPVAVEVGERDSSPVLLAVLHTLTTFMKERFSC